MASVSLFGIDRPGIVHQLAVRGVAATVLASLESLPGNAAPVLAMRAAPDRQLLDHVRERWTGAVMALVPGREQAQIAALDAGYDDAVATDCSDVLIAARLVALLRRRTGAHHFRIGDLVIDTVDCRVRRGGRQVALLPREYRLLIELARRPGAVVSRQDLVSALCGLSFDPGTKVIEVHVSRLRSKIDRGFATPMVLTEKGVGYRLATPTAEPMPELPIAAIAASR